MAQALQFVREVACVSDVKSMWTLLSDTEQLNLNLGHDTPQVTPLQNETAARFTMHMKLDGFNVAYSEEPYEWTYQKMFRVRRHFTRGPLRMLMLQFEFMPKDSGCSVRITLELTPHNMFISPIVSMRGRSNTVALVAEVERADAAIQKGALEHWNRRKPLINDAELTRRMAGVRQAVGEPTAAYLDTYLRTASDLDVVGMRPYSLADGWKMDRTVALRMLFAAADTQVVESRWQIICPSCRAPTDSLPDLQELASHGACHFCDIGFDVSLEDAVEVMFNVVPAVRSLAEGVYCIGGPQRTPHVLAQCILPPRGKGILMAPTLPGEYRIFVRGGAQCALLVNMEGVEVATLACESLNRRAAVKVAPTGTVELVNNGDQGLHAKLELATWSSHAASAADVTRLTAKDKPIAL